MTFRLLKAKGKRVRVYKLVHFGVGFYQSWGSFLQKLARYQMSASAGLSQMAKRKRIGGV